MIDRKPVVARILIDIQIFSDRQSRRNLNRADERHFILNPPQLIDIRVKNDEADLLLLLVGCLPVDRLYDV